MLPKSAKLRVPLERLPRILLTLLLGAVGGALFHAAQLPPGWMIGSICVTTVLALGMESVFVATHHVARVTLIVLGASVLYRFVTRKEC